MSLFWPTVIMSYNQFQCWCCWSLANGYWNKIPSFITVRENFSECKVTKLWNFCLSVQHQHQTLTKTFGTTKIIVLQATDMYDWWPRQAVTTHSMMNFYISLLQIKLGFFAVPSFQSANGPKSRLNLFNLNRCEPCQLVSYMYTFPQNCRPSCSSNILCWINQVFKKIQTSKNPPSCKRLCPLK